MILYVSVPLYYHKILNVSSILRKNFIIFILIACSTCYYCFFSFKFFSVDTFRIFYVNCFISCLCCVIMILEVSLWDSKKDSLNCEKN
uniref:Uncharacterized protein n=2 Tax=unclassified Caudoviricetes TaxID=2788787 RepID=A0A8S5NMR1_9CAUD|nr:MAG TPA: hypothetical protein [Myoviridae sp. ctSGm32]DAD99007.1 MAG TPA: hypothetical protein [Myoviridae sp. ctjs85]